MEIDKKTFNKWLKFGLPGEVLKSKKFKNAFKELVSDFEVSNYKIHSKMYDRNSFNFDDFKTVFAGKRLTSKGTDRLFFKAQIYAKMNKGYVIPEYNFGVYSKKMKQGIELLFSEIDTTIKKWQSLLYFYFNFIDVMKVSIKKL